VWTVIGAVVVVLVIGGVVITLIVRQSRKLGEAEAVNEMAEGELDAKDEQIAAHQAGRGPVGGLLAGLRRAKDPKS
jgi:uncharacterized membrane-anchored protein YhcB (DUF1043 family)